MPNAAIKAVLRAHQTKMLCSGKFSCSHVMILPIQNVAQEISSSGYCSFFAMGGMILHAEMTSATLKTPSPLANMH